MNYEKNSNLISGLKGRANLPVTMTKNFLIAISLMGSLTVFAGQGSSGGGNTLNGQIIENYESQNPFTKLPQFEEAKEELFKKIHELAPDFADTLETNLQSYSWYLLPVKFQTLPENVTGLSFTTDQPAYQNDEEIFVSIPAINEMETNELKNLYKHEIIMTALRYKDSRGHSSVRKVMQLLRKEEVSAAEFCHELGRRGFGHYMTKQDKEYLKMLDKIVEQKMASCADLDLEPHGNFINPDELQTSKGKQKAYDLMQKLIGFSISCRWSSK